MRTNWAIGEWAINVITGLKDENDYRKFLCLKKVAYVWLIKLNIYVMLYYSLYDI